MLRSEYSRLKLTGSIKWSVLGDEEDVQKIKHALKLWDATIVGVYKKKGAV